MTPLSRWKLSKDDEEKVNEVLVSELTRISNEKEIVALLKVLLTDTERLMVAKRIFAFVMIDQNESDTEISKRLHFTRETVARLRRNYKHLDDVNMPVKPLVKRISESEILKELMNKFLKYAIAAAGGRAPRGV